MAENQTCFPEVEFNEVLQDKIIKSVFDKLATCTDEQTLKNNINLILRQNEFKSCKICFVCFVGIAFDYLHR